MSVKTRFNTVVCPKCNQRLPGWAQTCQFCGAQLQIGYARAVDPNFRPKADLPSWTEAGYIVIGVLLLIRGGIFLLQAFSVIPNEYVHAGFGTFIGLIGAIHTTLALGMLAHQIWAQFILKWGCVLACIVAAFELMKSLLMLFTHAANWFVVLLDLISLIIYGFTVYIINIEADV